MSARWRARKRGRLLLAAAKGPLTWLTLMTLQFGAELALIAS
jgi:hypothetical protein